MYGKWYLLCIIALLFLFGLPKPSLALSCFGTPAVDDCTGLDSGEACFRSGTCASLANQCTDSTFDQDDSWNHGYGCSGGVCTVGVGPWYKHADCTAGTHYTQCGDISCNGSTPGHDYLIDVRTNHCSAGACTASTNYDCTNLGNACGNGCAPACYSQSAYAPLTCNCDPTHDATVCVNKPYTYTCTNGATASCTGTKTCTTGPCDWPTDTCPVYTQSTYAVYAQSTYAYAQSTYGGPYAQSTYYAQSAYYAQASYYAQSAYAGYTQSTYYAQGTYAVYAQSSYAACPWVQTTGGDVYSGTNINTPCGP